MNVAGKTGISPSQVRSLDVDLSPGEQGQRLQDADAFIGRPLSLIRSRSAPGSSDLLHRIASEEPPKPPVDPSITLDPDGKPNPTRSRKTTPEVGIAEPLPPTPKKNDPEVACTMAYERCQNGCSKIRSLAGRAKAISSAAKGLCYSFCFAELTFCRFSGFIHNSQQ